MALEELLRQKQAENGEETGTGTDRSAGGLIRRICGETPPKEEEGLSGPESNVLLPDGYLRLTPVQPYRTPADYRRRRVRRAVLAILLLCLAAALAVTLWRSGLVSIR